MKITISILDKGVCDSNFIYTFLTMIASFFKIKANNYLDFREKLIVMFAYFRDFYVVFFWIQIQSCEVSMQARYTTEKNPNLFTS